MVDDLKTRIKIVTTQTLSSVFITIGGVVFGLGAAMWYFSKVLMVTENYSEFDFLFVSQLHQSGFTFLVLGVVSLVIGGLFSFIMLNRVLQTKSS